MTGHLSCQASAANGPPPADGTHSLFQKKTSSSSSPLPSMAGSTTPTAALAKGRDTLPLAAPPFGVASQHSSMTHSRSSPTTSTSRMQATMEEVLDESNHSSYSRGVANTAANHNKRVSPVPMFMKGNTPMFMKGNTPALGAGGHGLRMLLPVALPPSPVAFLGNNSLHETAASHPWTPTITPLDTPLPSSKDDLLDESELNTLSLEYHRDLLYAECPHQAIPSNDSITVAFSLLGEHMGYKKFFQGPGKVIDLYCEPLDSAMNYYHTPFNPFNSSINNPLITYGGVDGFLLDCHPKLLSCYKTSSSTTTTCNLILGGTISPQQYTWLLITMQRSEPSEKDNLQPHKAEKLPKIAPKYGMVSPVQELYRLLACLDYGRQAEQIDTKVYQEVIDSLTVADYPPHPKFYKEHERVVIPTIHEAEGTDLALSMAYAAAGAKRALSSTSGDGDSLVPTPNMPVPGRFSRGQVEMEVGEVMTVVMVTDRVLQPLPWDLMDRAMREVEVEVGMAMGEEELRVRLAIGARE
ncbi:hypothetical protein B0H10DRAFT_1947387 [Mycena sp. CBHHK59/15]|nr:hypothetical protein B0H10DRAFT_1947387 [Mycena sp. CBHHK59/15]